MAGTRLDEMKPVHEGGDDGELWMIVAYIRPFKLDAAVLALEGIPGGGGMTVARAAHAGNHGDGKVLVWPFAHAVRIRTMETDAAAVGGQHE